MSNTASAGRPAYQSQRRKSTLKMRRRRALVRATINAASLMSVATTSRTRPFARERERDRARSGPEIEHAQCAIPRQTRERALDQRFRFRSRDQHGRRDAKLHAPEFAPSGQVGDRLAVAAPAREREKLMRALGRQLIGGVRGQPRTVGAEHVREQHLRIDRRQAALRERLGERSPSSRASLRGEQAQSLVVVVAPAAIGRAPPSSARAATPVARSGDADDPVEAEIVEAVAYDRGRAFGRESLAPASGSSR